MNEDECMVMVFKWDYGILSYRLIIRQWTKSRRYGNECMKLEIMVWIYGIAIKVLNEGMVL